MGDEVKKCPGLHGLYCGEPRKKAQAYCGPHGREYQRERYQNRTNEAKMFRFSSIRRQDAETGRIQCSSCRRWANELFALEGVPETQAEPLCEICVDFFHTMRNEYGVESFMAIVRYAMRFEESILRSRGMSDALKVAIETRMWQMGKLTYDKAQQKDVDFYAELIKVDMERGFIKYDPDQKAIIHEDTGVPLDRDKSYPF